jgi:sortase A
MKALGIIAVAFLSVAAAAVQSAAATTRPVTGVESAAATRPIGRIVIPAIRLDTPFANGQAPANTALSPSHYPSTALPGQGRTVGIAGHRITHTRPFFHLAELRGGDMIEIHFGRGPAFRKEACYRVRRMAIVKPGAVDVLREMGHDRLVLTTCHPPGTSISRLVVIARRAACQA